ncbi:MAG TPA: VanZ family protein, partial [Rheinheimera sp.]|nr:VanZ family protein [Rheinheimera sp.]
MNNNSSAWHGNSNTALTVALLLYLVFVIYGSLVPLHFVAKPFAEAVAEFQQIPYLTLDIRSRADWVANILLFIPLSFLISLLVLERQWSPLVKIMLSLVIWCACSALAVGIEFTQVFFPQRTVSINDIVAESSGAAIGILIYWYKGKQLKQFIASFTQMRGKDSVQSYLLLSYIAVFVLYNILPLDLTLSSVELFKKWREGRIVLLPFIGYEGSVIEIGYAVISDILLWVPIAVLLYLQKLSHKTLYVRVLLLAVVLEFCQLFVYSRVSDISDVLCALIASWGSIVVLKRWRPENTEHAQLDQTHQQMLKLLAAILIYAVVILFLLWYPFNFDFDWSTINARLKHAQAKVLLESLYFGTEYRAITALLQKLILFMPLGALFAAVYQRCSLQWQRQVTLTVAVGFITGLALLSEAMQLALPGKTVDATDVLL